MILVLGVSPRAWAGFSFDASDYAEGESASAKGAESGTWASDDPSDARPVARRAEGRMGLDLGSVTRATFTADAVPEGTAAVYDYALFVDGLTSAPFAGTPDEGLAQLAPAVFADGTTGLYAAGDGVWQALSSPEIVIVDESWIDCRIELREAAGDRFVSYLVRAVDSWIRLSTRTGRTWFRAGHSPESVRRTSLWGPGCIAAASGRETPGTDPQPLYWIGGKSGDWNAEANWSLTPGGASAGRLPTAGEVAVIDGSVDLTDGDARARTSRLIVAVGADGAKTILGGSVAIDPSIDLSRPCAGQPLAVNASAGIFDVQATLSCSWWRANVKKAWASSPFSMQAVFTPTVEDYGSWFRVCADNGSGNPVEREFYFSRLPVFYMTTDDGLVPSPAKEEHAGRLYVQGNDTWASPYDNAMTIKVRGNTTSKYPKKPWKIKLDKKTAMFGLPKSKHWVLLANYNDMAQLRGKFAADFANEIGSLGMKSTWVECVLNGESQGLYQFSEHIRVDPARVPIYDWEDHAADYGATAEDFSAIDRALADNPGSIDISGGYLFEFSAEYDELSKFTTYSGKLQMRTMVNKPECLYTSAAMMDWCRAFLQDYWDAVTSPDRMSRGRHYSAYADVDSMVNYTLVNELFANADASKKSRYAFVDRGGKLVFGPVWDFDWGCGSVKVSDKVDYWTCSKSAQGETDVIYSFFKEWASDDYFCRKLYKRYWEIRDRYVEIFKDGGWIDAASPLLAEAGRVDDDLWPRGRTSAEDRVIMKDYLARRVAWLDGQFASPQKLLASLKTSIQTSQSSWDPDAVRPAEGEVPEIRLEWVREALEPKDPSFGYASPERLSAAVTAVPTPWGKNVPLWQDYIAGTNPDPSGENAEFRVTKVEFEGGLPRVIWTPDLGRARKYTVWGRESLTEGSWHEQTEGDRFFKVAVELP